MRSHLWSHCEKDVLKIEGNFTIGLLDPRHVVLQLDLEEDFIRIWVKGQLSFQGLPMHIFKWFGIPCFGEAITYTGVDRC